MANGVDISRSADSPDDEDREIQYQNKIGCSKTAIMITISFIISMEQQLQPSSLNQKQSLLLPEQDGENTEKQVKVIEYEEKNQQGDAEKKQDKPMCEYYVSRKRRNCKFVAAKGSKFCSAHCSDLEGKVECPYQKGLFIAKQKLQKHLKHCPIVMNKQKQQSSGWFNKDINKGELEQAPTQLVTLNEVNPEIVKKVVLLVVKMYLQIFNKEECQFIGSNQLENLEGTTNDHMQAKLITQKAFSNKLVAPEFIYVEFGAGKGILSFAIATKIEEQFQKHSKNVLLERESRRNKFDKFFRDNPYFQRYKGDVGNFDFAHLPSTMAKTAIQKCRLTRPIDEIQKQIGQCELVGICKHMCGEALDVSVRGMMRGNVKGCILASCCHHLCKVATYLNPNFFYKAGLSPEELQILFRLSSWGTRSHRFGTLTIAELSSLGDKSQLELDEKILVGRMAKRLIDAGRAQFLGGRMYRYCSDQLTPENYVIISRQ